MTPLRDGRYLLASQLGAGAQGSTWDAIDKREGRKVAIKRFDVRDAKQWKDVELAEREARVLASLHHPKLPGYIEHFEEDGALYLVMEKIEGTPTSRTNEGRALGEDDIRRLLEDADDVLTYLHSRTPPVIHRDIKPSNVIRRPDGSFAFVDFGSVRERLRVEGGSTVAGTFGFMAPEQFQGRAGPGTDVYAVGATALTLLTGVQPEDWPHHGLEVDIDALLGRQTNPLLKSAIARMLEPNPDLRPTSIGPLLRTKPRDPGESARRNDFEDVYRNVFGDAAARARSQVDDHLRRKLERTRAKFERKAARAQRKAAEREARRGHHGPSHGQGHRRGGVFVFLWIPMVFVGIALNFARGIVGLGARVVVPTILLTLAWFFGPGLRTFARNVRRGSEASPDERATTSTGAQGTPPSAGVSVDIPAREQIVDAEFIEDDAGSETSHPTSAKSERR